MKQLSCFFGLAALMLLQGCNGGTEKKEDLSVQVIAFEDLESEITKSSNKLKVVNFWATWCKPCIEEMPYFDAVIKQESESATLYFVSLDFVEDLERVTKFVEKKKPYGKVMLLDNINYDSFMPKVDSSWTGAIPATLFVDSSGNQYFYEKSFSQDELSTLILSLL